MDIYELIGEINASRQDHHRYTFLYSFNQSNRAKLENPFDLEVFDLVSKAYGIPISYISDRRDNDVKLDYQKYSDEGIIPFKDIELKLFNDLDWTRLPHNLKAHIYDVIWLFNHKYEAAKVAIEEYHELYHELFDELDWVECVDYIGRAIELAAKIGLNDKKEELLAEVYNDIVRLNGDDSSFLSISLIELIIHQNYHCDLNKLIPIVDKLISKNKRDISTSHILEQAYYVKAELYKKLKDPKSENNVYVQYANFLMQRAETFVIAQNDENAVEDRNWFMSQKDIKEAIELYQKHGAAEKAVDAQKHLVEIQKATLEHVSMHEFIHKYDVSEFYKKFNAEHENHNVHELIWDIVFEFSFQNKQQIREDVIKNSPIILSMIPTHFLGAEGQTEFVLPGLNLNDENTILMHMYYKAKEYEMIYGQTLGAWFIQSFQKLSLQEADLDLIFENNAIIPKGQEKDVQRGVYYGLTGHLSDAIDKLAPKTENIIRNLAEMCGDLTTYYDVKEGIQQKKVLSKVFEGKMLNECLEENILFTFNGLLQQKAGSNIRNRIGHGLNTEAECYTGDCIYFVMIVLKFCALHCDSFQEEYEKRKQISICSYEPYEK